MDHRDIFANSEIFYDSTFKYFTTHSDKVFDSTFYGISRCWLDEGYNDNFWRGAGSKLTKGTTLHPYPRYGSHDTFSFKPRMICEDKAKLKNMAASLNYTLGILGAENRLSYGIKKQYPKMRLENPYKTVKTVHIHQSKLQPSAWAEGVNRNGKSVEIEGY
ncbi:hypothetical protein BGZ92_007890 [Podila epicladia]|nr:hypothetical protein BGZ92_007890 [Podila epicladia]